VGAEMKARKILGIAALILIIGMLGLVLMTQSIMPIAEKINEKSITGKIVINEKEVPVFVKDNKGATDAQISYENDTLTISKEDKKLEFSGIKEEAEINVGFDDKIDSRFIESYAIDPTKINFSSAKLTTVAKGKSLFKCKEWDFEKQECKGRWKKVQGLQPGDEYSIEISADDPGYGESNSTIEVLDENNYLYNYTETITNSTNTTADVTVNISDTVSIIQMEIKEKNLAENNSEIYLVQNGNASDSRLQESVTIDTTNITFSNATFVKSSKGRDLLECNDWNSSSKKCISNNWTKIKETTINQAYQNLLTRKKTTYAETKDTVAVFDKKGNLMQYNEKILNDNALSSDAEYEFIGLSIKKIKFFSYNKSSKSNDLVVEHSISNVSSPSHNFVRAFGIDPTNLTFSYAELSATASGKYLFKCKDWNASDQTCLGEWKKLAELVPGEEYIINITADDPGFLETNNSIVLIDNNDTLLFYNETILSNVNNITDIELDIYNGAVSQIVVYGHDESSEDNILKIKHSTEETNYIQSYSIDPTNLSFSNASVTVTATGNELYKCKNWNFTSQQCSDGNWTLFKSDLIPGQQYTFTLTAEDPGFGEINITAAQHLDENRTFISDIYDETYLQDNIWSEPIYHNEYARAVFEKYLSNYNTINLYVRNNQSLNTSIIIYEQNKSTVVGSTPVITSAGMYNVHLTSVNGSNTIFDMKVSNAQNNSNAYLEFDYIHDAGATGTPRIGMGFFLDSDSGIAGDTMSLSDGVFGESPIQMNDYGTTTEKCGLWDCSAWTGGTADKATYCSGGWNCSSWNGVTCAEYKCLTWTVSGTIETEKYCSGGWNCSSMNGNYCSKWDCLSWTDSLNRYDKYCSGQWTCGSWNNGTCASWNCSAWSDGITTKIDTYCSGAWQCNSLNSTNGCTNWSCTAYSAAALASFDAYCNGGWQCENWNESYCNKWNCTSMTTTGTVKYDNYCDSWNCTTWNETTKACQKWDCLQWIQGATTNLPYYCSGSISCTSWKTFTYDIQYSNISVSPAEPVTYSTITVYRFNSTWAGSVDNVVLQLDNANYTVTGSGGVYSKNFTGLAAGTHNYTWYANNTAGNSNQTQQLNYTINKAAAGISLKLNGSSSGITITKRASININATKTVGESSYIEVYENGLMISNGTSPLSFNRQYNNSGLFEIEAVYPETENYSSIGISYIATVLEDPSINSISDSPDPVNKSGNITITANITDDDSVASARVNINGTNYTMQNTIITGNRNQIFYDGFESGNLSTNGWTITYGGVSVEKVNPSSWNISTSDPYNGTYHIKALYTGGQNTTIRTSITTKRYRNITLSFYEKSANMEAGDNFVVQWYNGTAWISIYNKTTNNAYTLRTFNLTSDADNNPNFKIKFICLNNADTEVCEVDNVNITGISRNDDIWSYSYNTSSLNSGLYNYNVYATDSTGNTANATGEFTVQDINDATPPASATNLANKSAGTTWIYWNWSNPSDSDFSSAILYLNDANVANTSNNYYNATGMLSGVNYTLIVNTKDVNGNVNYTNVSSSARTISISVTVINESSSNSTGVTLNTALVLIADNGTTVYNSTNLTHTSVTIQSGLYTVIVQPVNYSISEVKMTEAYIGSNTSKIVDFDSFSMANASRAFAINPYVNFTSAAITLTAAGTDLYKCSNWNFTTQNCTDNSWIKILDVVPGQSYTFMMYNSTDPGFMEANYTKYYLHNESDSQYASYKQMKTNPTDLASISSESATLSNNLVTCWNASWIAPNWTMGTRVNGTWSFSIYTNCSAGFTNAQYYLSANITKVNSTGNFTVNTPTAGFACASGAAAVKAWNYTLSDSTVYDLAAGERIGTRICVRVTGGGAANKYSWMHWENTTMSNVIIPVAQYDDIPPSINFTSPTETSGSVYSRRNILANVTASDSESGLKNITIRLYNSSRSLINSTNSTSSQLFANFSVSVDGIYYFNATAWDNTFNANSTETRNVTIDTTAPGISITYPANQSYNINVSALNYTVSDANLQACWYSLNNGQTNTTITCGDNLTGKSSAEGSNTWKVYANDSAGNFNTSSVTFSKDTINPQITINIPSSNNSKFNYMTNVNYTYNDTNTGACRWTQNSGVTNTSLTNCQTNITGQTWQQGLTTVIIYSNDTYGNINSSIISFNTDTINPQINFTSPTPQNGTIQNQNWAFINITSNEDLNTAILEWNNVNETMTGSGTSWYKNKTNLASGTYTYKVYGNDTAGNLNSTEKRTLIINGAPNITLNYPGNNSQFIDIQTITFNFTATDDLNITLNCSIYLDNNLNKTNSTTKNGTVTNFNITGISYAAHTWFVNCSDGSLNNISGIRTFSITDSAPVFLSASPPANSQYNQTDSVQLKVNMSKNSTVTANVSWDAASQLINLVYNGSNWRYNVTFTDTLYPGNYAVNISATSSYGSLNSTLTNFTVNDITNPFVAQVQPSGTIYKGGTTVNISANVSDYFYANLAYVNANVSWDAASQTVNLTYNSAAGLFNGTFSNTAADGQYNITIIAVDNAGNTNNSEKGSFTIDAIAPAFSATMPSANAQYNQSQTVALKTSLNENSTVTANVSWDAASQLINLVYNGSNWWHNATFTDTLYPGNYAVNISATDNVGNANSTLTNFIVNDVAAPLIEDATPAAGSNYNQSVNIIISANVTDPYYNSINKVTANVTWSSGSQIVNLTYNSTTGKYQTTFASGSVGTYNVTIFANDTFGNLNSTVTWFYINDTTPPVIVNANATKLNNSAETIVWATDESSSSIVNYGLTTAFGSNVNNTGLVTSHSILLNNLSYGSIYYYNVTSCDVNGNCATEGTYNFTISDTTPPQVTGYSISNYAPIINETVFINASATDDLAIYGIFANITLPNGTVMTFSIPLYLNVTLSGRHNVTIFANDTSGNVATAVHDYFIAGQNITVQFNVVDSNLSGIENNLTIYLAGTNKTIQEHEFTGQYTDYHAGLLYDLLFKSYNGSVSIKLFDVNVSIDNNRTLGIDKTTISGYLVTYGINSTYASSNNTNITINYTGLSYSSEDALSVEKCSDWSFTTRICNSSWAAVSAIQNKTQHTFTFNVVSFSAFSIKETAAPAPSAPSAGGGGWGGGGKYTPPVICKERWQCTDWGKCENGITRRSCSDMNSCGTENDKPDEAGSCVAVNERCFDGILSQDESDADCGGRLCKACEIDQKCYSNRDCKSNYCYANACKYSEEAGPPEVKGLPGPPMLSWTNYLLLYGLLLIFLIYLIYRITPVVIGYAKRRPPEQAEIEIISRAKPIKITSRFKKIGAGIREKISAEKRWIGRTERKAEEAFKEDVLGPVRKAIRFIPRKIGEIEESAKERVISEKRWAARIERKAEEAFKEDIVQPARRIIRMPGKVKEDITERIKEGISAEKRWFGRTERKAEEAFKEDIVQPARRIIRLPGKVKEDITERIKEGISTEKRWFGRTERKAEEAFQEDVLGPVRKAIRFIPRKIGEIRDGIKEKVISEKRWAARIERKAEEAFKEEIVQPTRKIIRIAPEKFEEIEKKSLEAVKKEIEAMRGKAKVKISARERWIARIEKKAEEKIKGETVRSVEKWAGRAEKKAEEIIRKDLVQPIKGIIRIMPEKFEKISEEAEELEKETVKEIKKAIKLFKEKPAREKPLSLEELAAREEEEISKISAQPSAEIEKFDLSIEELEVPVPSKDAKIIEEKQVKEEKIKKESEEKQQQIKNEMLVDLRDIFQE
jgi:3-dehydroquinate dehydratase